MWWFQFRVYKNRAIYGPLVPNSTQAQPLTTRSEPPCPGGRHCVRCTRPHSGNTVVQALESAHTLASEQNTDNPILTNEENPAKGEKWSSAVEHSLTSSLFPDCNKSWKLVTDAAVFPQRAFPSRGHPVGWQHVTGELTPLVYLFVSVLLGHCLFRIN